MPDRADGDENAYDERPSALCEACEERAGCVSEEGAWLCLRCSAALELAEADAS
jgi:hypothetical protein